MRPVTFLDLHQLTSSNRDWMHARLRCLQTSRIYSKHKTCRISKGHILFGNIPAGNFSSYQTTQTSERHLIIATPFRTSRKKLPPSLDTEGVSGDTMSTVDPSWLIHTRRGAKRGVVIGSRVFARPTLSNAVALVLIHRGYLGRALSKRVVTRACWLPRMFVQLCGRKWVILQVSMPTFLNIY